MYPFICFLTDFTIIPHTLEFREWAARVCSSIYAAARISLSGFTVFTPTTSRYRTIQISAMIGTMTMTRVDLPAEVGDQERREQFHQVADGDRDEGDAERLGEQP